MDNYINSKGNEIPDNTILVVPHVLGGDGHYLDIIQPLLGVTKRDWFTDHFYYCLPLVTGNQYGFLVKAAYGFTAYWPGGTDGVAICKGEDANDTQLVDDHFKRELQIEVNN